jgi:hypothetical protein
MSISGWTTARCKECKCRFMRFIDSPWLFVDEEVIGTCDNCFNRVSHDCIDELTENENGSFLIVGRKEFDKK